MKRLPLPAVLLLLLAGVWMTKTRKGVITSQSAGEVLLVAEQANARPDRTGPQTGASQVAKALRQIDTSTKPRQVARGIPITPEFVRNLATGPRKISFKLPDGRWAEGSIDQRHTAADGSPAGVSGRLVAPGAGTFHFRVQPAGASSGPVVGAVVMDEAEIAFGVLPGAGMTSVLTARPVDQVICRSYTLPPENADGPQEIMFS